MKRKGLLIPLVMLSISSFAQKFESDPAAISGFQDKEKIKQQMALKNRNAQDDKVIVVEVTGIGGGSFSTMNYPDGSSRNNNLSLKTTLKLTVSANNAGSYQLVFYSENEKPVHVAEQSGTETSIFYPISLYDVIRQKIEQATMQKKKCQIKLTTSNDGYREAVLIY